MIQLFNDIYLNALAIFILFFIAAKITVIIIEKVILKLAKKTETEIDDMIVEETKRPISLLLIAIGLKLAIYSLPLIASIENTVHKILDTFVIIFIVVIIMRIVNILIKHWGTNWAAKSKSSVDDELVILAYKASNVIIVILGFLYVVNYWGIQIGPLLASVGIGGIALAFALQSSLGNVFGGIALILDKNMKVGQNVDVNGIQGEIIDIGFRSTKVRSWDNEMVIIPNGVLADSTFKNLSQPTKKMRMVIPFGVEYGADVAKVKKIVEKELPKVPGYVDKPGSRVSFVEMGDSALIFKAYFHIEGMHTYAVALDGANTKIYDALNKAKIGIPFPQMDVHIKKK